MEKTDTVTDFQLQQRKLAFTRALVVGLSRLIENQRQLAEGFGLTLGQAFPSSHRFLENQTAMQFTISLFRGEKDSVNLLTGIINDLVGHQETMHNALDGVALEAVRLTKEYLEDAMAVDMTANSQAYLSELAVDPDLRFEMIVAPGFVEEYRHGQRPKINRQVVSVS